MFDYNNIDGIDVLKEKIPPELQNWHCFGTILELKATPHRAGGADTQSDFSSDCTEMMPLG